MMGDNYIADRLYDRLFRPWLLPESDWKLCRDDWIRVDTICALPWSGNILDFGAGDGTLASLLASRNPGVSLVTCIEADPAQEDHIKERWMARGWPLVLADNIVEASDSRGPFDGVLCAEVLEHLDAEAGLAVLCDLRRALKPGATICCTVPHPDGTRQDYPGHQRRIYGNDLVEDLIASGFKSPTISLICGPNLDPIWLMAVARA